MDTPQATLNDGFLALLRLHVPTHSPVTTLGSDKPNWVTRISPEGLYVETERTRSDGTKAQLVPAWMLLAAWERLTDRGSLTNAELVSSDDLNVKRSSFVCAVLPYLPGVKVTSTRPIALSYAPDPSE